MGEILPWSDVADKLFWLFSPVSYWRRPTGQTYAIWWNENIDPPASVSPDDPLPVVQTGPDIEFVPELPYESPEMPKPTPVVPVCPVPDEGPSLPPPAPGGGPPLPPPPPPTTTRPKTKNFVDAARTLRLSIRKLQRGSSNAPGRSVTQTGVSLTPGRAIAHNQRVKLQQFVTDNNYWPRLRAIGANLVREDFAEHVSLESLNAHVFESVARYNQELENLPESVSDLRYMVEYSTDALLDTSKLWPIARLSILNAINAHAQLVESLSEDMESLNTIFLQSAVDTWEEFDARYMKLLERVRKFEDNTKMLLLYGEQFSASKNGPRRVLQAALPRESEMVSDGVALGQPITMVKLQTEDFSVTVEEAMKYLGVNNTLALEYAKKFVDMRRQVRRLLYMAYVGNAFKNLQRLWDLYESSGSKSDRFRENIYVSTVNAIVLFGTKRIGGDKQLEELVAASDLDKRLIALSAEAVRQMDEGAIEIAPEKFTVDAAFEGLDLDFCDQCGRNDIKLHRCTRCEIAYYCGETCSQSHWNVHQLRCQPRTYQ